MWDGAKILVTGLTGSWGHELARQLLSKNPKQIIGFSRNEFLQVEMQREFNDPRLTFVIGDVRDKEAIDQAFAYYKPDYVFMLSALKHVPICENMPQEAIKTNINGISNVIQAAIKHKAKKVIDVSSDKACNPVNLYGLTKAVGEKLTIQANCLTRNTDFIVIRGGNVLGTNGSLVPYVIFQIKKCNSVKITDPAMTRFFLTLPQAITLLLFAAQNGIGGETYVMNMPSFKIKDIVNVLIERFGDAGTKIEYIGAREGEKTHEELISSNEAKRSFVVNKDYYVIYPEIGTGRMYQHLLVKYNNPLDSMGNLMDIASAKGLLEKGGFLS